MLVNLKLLYILFMYNNNILWPICQAMLQNIILSPACAKRMRVGII